MNSSHLPTGSATQSTVMACTPPGGMEPNPGYTVNMPWVKRACRNGGGGGGVDAEGVEESELFYQSCKMASRGTHGASHRLSLNPSFLLEPERALGIFRDGLPQCFSIRAPSF